MARAIDAVQVLNDINWHHKPTPVSEFESGFNQGLNQAMWIITHAPTLTPPNETPPCYQPDGDGCAYQCYDGQDEPIDKCKECPLCYSDKQRQHTPPNEPLTLEQLREMDGEPVWVDDEKTYAILQVWDDDNIDAIFSKPRGCIHAKYAIGMKIYRRPPEGEEDT